MFNKLKGLKLYSEAEENIEDGGETVIKEEEEITPTEDVGGEQTIDNNNDLGNDFSEYGSEFENEDDFQVPDDYNANDYYDTQIVDGTDDENSAEFKRRRVALEKAYGNLYDKYKDVIIHLKDIDATGDKATVLNAIIKKYEELLEAVVAYCRDCDDSFEVKYKVFIEFRAAFITINSELSDIDADIQLIQ